MNELTIINEETLAVLEKAAELGAMAQGIASNFRRTFALAEATQQLKAALTPKVLQPIMAMQNSAIGFRTDKPSGYPAEVVKEALIEATLNGVFANGNEFNVIAGRCYITKEGFYHKLRDIDGLTWTETPHIPQMANGGAIAKVTLEWTYQGESHTKDLEFAVRVNQGMGADAINGKAIRKARAWLFTAITGRDTQEGEAEEPARTTIQAEVKTESALEKVPEQTAAETDLNLQQM